MNISCGVGVVRTGIVITLLTIACNAFAAERQPSDVVTSRDVNARDYVDTQIREIRREVEQRYPTRDEFTKIIADIRTDIRRLEISEATIAGKASQEDTNLAKGIGVLALLVSLAGIVLPFFIARRKRENGNGK